MKRVNEDALGRDEESYTVARPGEGDCSLADSAVLGGLARQENEWALALDGWFMAQSETSQTLKQECGKLAGEKLPARYMR